MCLIYAGTLGQLMGWFLGLTTPLNLTVLFAVSGAIAFGFYTFGVFSPGDSKLLWGLCLILPPWWFGPIQELSRFLPVVMVLNIIVPYTVVAIVYLVVKLMTVRGTMPALIYFMKTSINRRTVLDKLFGLLQFILISVGLTYLLSRLGWELDHLTQFVIMLLIFAGLRKMLGSLLKTPTAVVITLFFCGWFTLKTSPNIEMLLIGIAFSFCSYLLIFVVAKELVLQIASVAFDQLVEVSNLQVGMIPSEHIFKMQQQDGSFYYEKRMSRNQRQGGELITTDLIGLSAETIGKLQGLAKAEAFAHFDDKIRIQPAIRFAPVIAFGGLLTVFCKGPFHLGVISLLNRFF